jgi:tyrosine-protein phosphatase SIW14
MNQRFAFTVFAVILWASFSVADPSSETPAIKNFHTVVEGQIFRGAEPDFKGLQYLVSRGVKTIINLENADLFAIDLEERQSSELGMNMIWKPMHSFYPPTKAQIDSIENVLSDWANYPIFIHCFHGQDRTGLVIGLFRVFREKPGMTAEKAYDEMLQLGFHPRILPLSFYYYHATGYRPLVLN